MNGIEDAFRGESIYGDGFSPEEVAAWFRDEQEGYAGLDYEDVRHDVYFYHASNALHGFSCLPKGVRYPRALGFGAAYGLELMPILDRIDHVTVVDPSDKFVRGDIGGKPATWVKPTPHGDLSFADGTFDIITCFGVLHHIPNVTAVIGELSRVLKPGGLLLMREPITSMGDWRQPRHGLTKRERGLPWKPFISAIGASGLRVHRRSFMMFRPWTMVCRKLGIHIGGSWWAGTVDSWLASATAWNTRYHAVRSLEKVCPGAMFVVAEKPR